jgi:hypothetical protein
MNQNFIYTLERIIFIFRREGKLGVLLCLFFETYHRSIVYKNSLLLFKMAIITVDVNLFRFQRHCAIGMARGWRIHGVPLRRLPGNRLA